MDDSIERNGGRMCGGRRVSVSGKVIRIARVSDEWYEDVDEPGSIVEGLTKAGVRADLFSFWQRLPNTQPRFHYHMEWDSIAALPVASYRQWVETQINAKTRNLLVKAKKKGLIVKKAVFDDDFIRGMADVFNETPVRQGKPFWHYGKSVETIRAEFSRYLFREDVIGAYWQDKLIGFSMIANAGRFAVLSQIISMIGHRDKSPNNALIAKAVEICAERTLPFLVYAMWPLGSLAEFKRHSGFVRVDLPRYYLPLNHVGRLALTLGVHRGPAERLPEPVTQFLRDVRSRFYALDFDSLWARWRKAVQWSR